VDNGVDNGGNRTESKLKSRVKVFTQIIIGRYLCPGSRAEIAEKGNGGKIRKTGYNAKQVVLKQHAEKGLYANGQM
jgi:hypothetical protein